MAICHCWQLQESLIEVCERNNLPWVEDPSNLDVGYWRNAVRLALSHDAELRNGLTNLVSCCRDVRKAVAQEGMSVTS